MHDDVSDASPPLPPALTQETSSQGTSTPFDPFGPEEFFGRAHMGVMSSSVHMPSHRLELSSLDTLAIDENVDNLHLKPPVVRHQGSSDSLSPAFRSLSGFGYGGDSPPPSAYDEYDDIPVYRSIPPALCSTQPIQTSAMDLCGTGYPTSPHVRHMGPVGDPFGSVGVSGHSWSEPCTSDNNMFDGLDHDSSDGPCYRNCSAFEYPRHDVACMLLDTTTSCPVVSCDANRSCFCFMIADDLLFHVLQLLDPMDAFAAMRVCTTWRNEASQIYARRAARVPAQPDALLQRIAQAQAGDTLLLEPGTHLLSEVALIDKPLKLRPVPLSSESSTTPDSQPVIVSTSHMLMHARCNIVIEGLTLVRMGACVGYPNAVVSIESGKATLQHCRITCGGASTDLARALDAFAASPPGTPSRIPGVPVLRPGAGEAPAPQDPQSGVWVGAAADVTLQRCLISCCWGPGIKIYRGKLHAEENAIAFSRCGGNIVANGGRISLARNTIRGAHGDGFVSWSNARVHIDNNIIHDNAGAGVAIKAGGGSVSITNNCVYNNSCSVADASNQATLNGNHKPDNTPVEMHHSFDGPLR